MTTTGNKEQYSEEVKHILYKQPMWLVQWGILFILVIFIVLTVCARFIPYPVKQNFPLSVNDSAGIALVPLQYCNLLQKGGKAMIVAYNENKRTRKILTAEIISAEPDSVSGQTLVTVMIPKRTIPVKDVNNETRESLQIITRESNLLNEIFRPFTGIFSGSGNQKKQ
jgi:hypothetical protein